MCCRRLNFYCERLIIDRHHFWTYVCVTVELMLIRNVALPQLEVNGCGQLTVGLVLINS
jgi:hypothetical protein